MSGNRDKWAAWVADAKPGLRSRRKLVAQVIACQCLAYRWVSYEKALDLLGGAVFNMAPNEAPERIRAAIQTCASCKWDAAEVRRLA